MYTQIQRDDPTLRSLLVKSFGGANLWYSAERATKGNLIIILCLSDFVLAKSRAIVDDDKKSATDLWGELKRLCTFTIK